MENNYLSEIINIHLEKNVGGLPGGMYSKRTVTNPNSSSSSPSKSGMLHIITNNINTFLVH